MYSINVDHILFTLKDYQKQILNPQSFYINILGINFVNEMIEIIKKNNILYDKVNAPHLGEIYVINRLITELKIDDNELVKRHKVFSSKFSLSHGTV